MVLDLCAHATDYRPSVPRLGENAYSRLRRDGNQYVRTELHEGRRTAGSTLPSKLLYRSLKPWPGSSVETPSVHDDVVAQQRPILEARAQVGADEVVDVALEDERLAATSVSSNQRKLTLLIIFSLGVRSMSTPTLTRNRPGLTKLALALDLARAQVGHQAAAVDQVDAEQPDGLPLPVAELAAGEVGVVEDGVEAGGVAVVGVVVAGGPEERRAEADPVAVVGQFDGGHLGVDVLRLVGERVEAVVAERPVERRA